MTNSITFSTHVLDTSTGLPLAGVPVRLDPTAGGRTVEGRTDDDGRLSFKEPLTPGRYLLSFDLESHFGERPHLSDRMTLRVVFDEPRHYHVPLLVSPFSFASYRGS